MKHLKYLAGSSLLSLACIGLFIACGDSEGESCLLDTDCVAPDVCEGEVCVLTCTTDEDCLEGEVCGARQNGTGTVCVVDTSGNANTGTGCADDADPNGFCEAQLGAGAFCDTTTNMCVGGANNVTDPVFVVQVQDVTTASEACDGVSDPGSDIQGIELQDDQGNSLGWGSIVNEAVALDGNEETNFDILDGTPPALDADGCVDSFSGNVLSLGCTGWVAVEFLDDGGSPVALAAGQTVFVYEYGGVCSTGTTDDEWTVSTCSDTAGISGGDDSSCTNVLGTGAGVGSVGVTL
jgi:hypothetical protein